MIVYPTPSVTSFIALLSYVFLVQGALLAMLCYSIWLSQVAQTAAPRTPGPSPALQRGQCVGQCDKTSPAGQSETAQTVVTAIRTAVHPDALPYLEPVALAAIGVWEATLSSLAGDGALVAAGAATFFLPDVVHLSAARSHRRMAGVVLGPLSLLQRPGRPRQATAGDAGATSAQRRAARSLLPSPSTRSLPALLPCAEWRVAWECAGNTERFTNDGSQCGYPLFE